MKARRTISGAPSTWRWTGRRSWHGCVPPAEAEARRGRQCPPAARSDRDGGGQNAAFDERGLNA